MKRILKVPEPADFSAWKEKDRMRHHPNWDRPPRPTKESIHDALMREQGFICCYCEARIAKGNSHIEHFRPKRKFPELQLDYTNFHCSCQREPSVGEPRHCGYAKGSWFNAELLVSPLAPDCEDRFRFTASGEILPRRDDDAGAKETIRRLRLDLPKLRALRAAAVNVLYNLATTEIRQLLARDTEGRFLDSHSTIKQVLLA